MKTLLALTNIATLVLLLLAYQKIKKQEKILWSAWSMLDELFEETSTFMGTNSFVVYAHSALRNRLKVILDFLRGRLFDD